MWDRHTSYSGIPPSRAVFFDGGLLSNFPIYVFHVDGIPRTPTLGAKLGTPRPKPNRISNPLNISGAALKSIRKVLDYDFITKNPDYKKLIKSIDTGEHHWLNFNLSKDDKIDLFKRGAEAASEFLKEFKWAEYKSFRENIHKAGITFS